MNAIHQLIPTLVTRDAIGAHTLRLRRELRTLGYRSEIYACEIAPELAAEARPFREFEPSREGRRTPLLYQLSTGSPMADRLARLPNPKILDYHNITPPAFYRGWDARSVARLASGERQLRDLAPIAELGLAASAFDRVDLERLGCRRSAVVPVLLDVVHHEPDPRTLERLERAKRPGGADWLFVGRLAPNKAQHDLVNALVVARRVYHPNARLRLVGSTSCIGYRSALERHIDELGLGDAVELAGSVTEEDLAAYYDTADVFVSASKHEGFGAPLIEAMSHGLPVVAFAAAAVPETLAGAGIALHRSSPTVLAAAAARVVDDRVLRERLVAKGHDRVAQFAPIRARERLREALALLPGVCD